MADCGRCGLHNELSAQFCAGCGSRMPARATTVNNGHLAVGSGSISGSRRGSTPDLGPDDGRSSPSLKRATTASPRGSSEGLATAENFWDIGNYKAALKRINSGPKLCDELAGMLQERASIEKHYAKELQSWSESWQDRLERINERGTLLAGWRSALFEAKTIAALHMGVRDVIEGPLKDQIEAFKNLHYAKSFMQIKSYKRANAAFSKAQNPWALRKNKIIKYQKTIAGHQESSLRLRADPHPRSESLAIKEEKAAALVKYKLAQRIDEMHLYREVYEREMQLEFAACQKEEKTRIDFFKDTLSRFAVATDVCFRKADVHKLLRDELVKVNADADLEDFSRMFGAGMPIALPDAVGDFTRHVAPGAFSAPPDTSALMTPPAAAAAAGPTRSATLSAAATTTATTAATSSFPPAPSAPDNDVAGLPPSTKLRALYDYTARNHDELSFWFDDVIIIISPTDALEVGWVRGRLDTGAEGIFPANYVEVDTDSHS